MDDGAMAGARTPKAAALASLALLVAAAVVGVARPAAAGSLAVVAQDVARNLSVAAPVLVVAAPLITDEPAPKGDDLALRAAALVAGRLGAGARLHAKTATLAAARGIAGRAGTLVYVQTEIARGDLRATLDAYPSVANHWDRLRNQAPSPVAHAFASAKIDVEVRSFLPTLVLEQASVHRFRLEESDVLAAACGDLDGDGGNEIVLVSRESVALGRVRHAQFVVERIASWSDLARRTAVPMRDPLAGAAVTYGRLAVGSTDRGGLLLGPDLAVASPIAGVPALGEDGVVCLRPEPSAGAFDGAPIACESVRDAAPKMAVPAPRYDAFASAAITDAAGLARTLVVVREPSGKLRLRVGDASPFAPDGTFGAQLAVGDLDQDGAAEIAVSSEAADDAIDVLTWPVDGAELVPRLHLPAPAGVRALAMCPPEDGAEPALVAVTAGELWIVRAAIGRADGTPGHTSEQGAPR